MKYLFFWRDMFRDHGPDTVSARALGLALSMYADSESGTAWPTQERLATDIASSQTTVTKYIGELEEAGWIERDRPGNQEEGQGPEQRDEEPPGGGDHHPVELPGLAGAVEPVHQESTDEQREESRDGEC
ncbi:MAG: helix-turn-helix domain-containing protein, partial [Bradymonadaceae bacterium]